MTGSSSEVHHPLFARVYDRLSAKTEEAGQTEHRRELLDGLAGRVLEVGAGNGLNFPHYPESVTEVVAVEPEPFLRMRAEAAAKAAAVSIRVVDGVADGLPVEDEAMDAAVACLVLCSVPDQAVALAELRRVIRPGGELRFYEHVLADRPGFARFQQGANAVWPLFAGGCHPNRRTGDAIERAGFKVESCRRFDFRPALIEAPVTPRILGVARRPV
jgi:ubiquinone/menaquinone biosynthesis C-methylase UbiE